MAKKQVGGLGLLIALLVFFMLNLIAVGYVVYMHQAK